MNLRLLLITIMLFTSFKFPLMAQKSGEDLFKGTCVACHTIGKGRLVGPDLSGIYEQQDENWLIRFIRSSQKMIKQGDSLAVAIFKEYNQIPMPDNNLTDEQIVSIIDYIKITDSSQSDEEMTQTEQTIPSDSTSVKAPSTEMINQGSALFYGYANFTNGTASCISCHQIQNGTIIGGGKLSLDLTNSYSRLGQTGIRAILSNPPFPVMNKAFQGQKLTNNEIQAIIAMLQYVDQHHSGDKSWEKYGLSFAILSLVLSIFMLILIYILYDNRKIAL